MGWTTPKSFAMKKSLTNLLLVLFVSIAFNLGAENSQENIHTRFLFGHVIRNGIKGEKIKLALAFEKEGEKTTDYFAYTVKIDTGAEVIEENAETSDIDIVIQLYGDEVYEFHRYKDGWSKIIKSGKLFLAQNPYPTTYNKLLSKAAEAAKDYVADEMKKQADSQAEKEQIKQGAKEADWKIYYDEYLVKEGNGGEWKIITRDNSENWATNLLKNCSAYKKADSKKQKQLTDKKMEYIHNTVNFYNNKCK